MNTHLSQSIDIPEASFSVDVDFLSQFDTIKPEEYSRARTFSVLDDSMSPKLIPNNDMLVVLVDPADYDQVSGIVLITRKEKPGEHVTGRVFAVDETSIHLSRDNAAWPGLSHNRQGMFNMYSVRKVINEPFQ